MRKIITATFISLDGVMQAPGGPQEDPTGGFEYGGWVAANWHEAVDEAISEAFAKPFDLLLGRKTYDIFAAHWPYVQKDPAGDGYDEGMANIGRLFDSCTKYVATRGNPRLDWQNSVSLGSDVVGALREIKRGDGPDLLIQGSSDFVQTLLAADLIDEIRLLIHPLVLGKGKRFFGTGTMPRALRLVGSTVAPNGVIIADYHRGGAVETGSFEFEQPTEAEIARRATLEG